MTRRRRQNLKPNPFFLLAALLVTLAGCSNDPDYPHTYTTRGVVVSMPGDKATQQFIVHHEAIPDYRSINGSVGMKEMAMPIPVPDASILKGFAVGDKVELTFGERFEPDHAMGLISIVKLDDGVELNLGKTRRAKPSAADAEGFVSIFDGKTLEGWEGDTDYWRVEDGAIVGVITEDNPLKRNTFLIYRGGEPSDFELKLEYRVAEGANSGIQYRSQEEDNFGMKGYQADIEHGPRWTGQCYDEGGRGFLAKRGESVVVEAGQPPKVVEQIGDPAELMKSVDLDGWNEYHLVVKGNHFIHYVNGVRMAEVVDNDKANRENQGLLGLQLHSGPPTEVAFKAIRLKR
ncbi:MAG: family 16 glycoside hydrolase [Phycisphaeraceae bacterium]